MQKGQSGALQLSTLSDFARMVLGESAGHVSNGCFLVPMSMPRRRAGRVTA